VSLPFADLKVKMLGTSSAKTSTSTASSKPLSLGQAIQALYPNANAKAETKKAQRQANNDIKESTS